MPLALNCDCGRALRVKDELAGKKIRCPDCKSILAVPAKKNAADEVVPEVLPVIDDEEGARRSSRRAAIQTDPPGPPLVRRHDGADDDPPRRKRRKRSRDSQSRAPLVSFEPGWFGSVNSGVVGGFLMILIAVVWFIGGLAVNRIFFYPPILLVIGIIAIVKGALGES